MKKIIVALLLSSLILSLLSCSGKENSETSDSTTGAGDAATTVSTGDEYDPFDDLADDDLVNATEYVYSDYSAYLNIPDLTAIIAKTSDVEEAVSDYVDSVLEYYQDSYYVDAGKDAILEEGNNANITYTGYSADPSVTLDEDTLSRMTNADDEEGYDLVIGSGAFIAAYTSTENPEKNHDSFENQLIGMKAGETRTITVTFPDSYSYNEALQGVEVSFDVTLNSISVQDNPTELTDDLISDYTGGEYTSASDFTDYLRSYYKGQVAYQALYDAIEILGYPENVIEEYVEEYVSEYLDYYYDEDEEVSEDELTSVREQATENAQETIGERLVWNYLFDYYQVTMTKAEYTAAIEENYNAYSTYYYYYYGLTDVSDFEDYFGRDYLISEFKYRTLVEKLADLITFE